jgi:GntR family transcriptional regulator
MSRERDEHVGLGGRPYAYARVHVAKHIRARAPKLFASRAALAVISEMDGLDIARAYQTLAIGAADMEMARNLGIALNAPTAGDARCVVTDAAGTVIYVGEITYPGDCVRLVIELIGERRSWAGLRPPSCTPKHPRNRVTASAEAGLGGLLPRRRTPRESRPATGA